MNGLRRPANDQFDGMIGPGQLLTWVLSSCPFLASRIAAVAQPLRAIVRPFDAAAGADGWLGVLAAAPALLGAKPTPATREDYFALCLAAHHATVGSFVPTDVDSKIRGDFWRRQSGESLRRRWHMASLARTWSTAGVSTRVEFTAEGPVSGHDGEWLGVATGALGAALLAGDRAVGDEAHAWITGELEREVRAFVAAEEAVRAGANDSQVIALSRLAWILTHNVGDIDQGLSHWPTGAVGALLRTARGTFGQLAHDRPARFSGVFHRAKKIYQVIAGEGHRHYPLRAVKALRTDATLLLPLGPCFESWGEVVARSTTLTAEDRAEVLAALCSGIGKVSGQVGYHRALVGLATIPGGLAGLRHLLPESAMLELAHPEVQHHLTLTAEQFAEGLARQIRHALG